MRCKIKRYGLSIPEWFCILGLLGIAAFLGLGLIGQAAKSKMDSDMNGPSGILGRQAAADGGSAATSESPTTHGNNGLGNGIDDAPPGNAPENDGAGTGPGNPGNRGGALR